jgi:hypothetical protein
VYINKIDAQILANSLYFSLDGSTCFGLSLVHHQQQHLISCTAQSVHAVALLRVRGSGVMRETWNLVNRGKQGKRERNKTLHFFYFFFLIFLPRKRVLRLCNVWREINFYLIPLIETLGC